MRGLLGHFSAMPLKDLVAYLGNRRASGLLRLRREEVHKQVHLRDGKVVGSTSNQVREYLGQFLVNMGMLTEDQFNDAYATQRETNVPLGKILVMIGLVKEDAVRRALDLKFRETLLDAFTWSEGEFSYDMTEVQEEGQDISASVDLLDIHREGQQREAAWQAIRAVFPSGGLRLALEEGRLPETLRPGSLDARLVQLIREGKMLEDLVRALHAPEFLLYQRLLALYRQEAVKVLGPTAPRPEAPAEGETETPVVEGEIVVGVEVEAEEPSVGELIQTAQSLLAEGNFRGGEALSRRAYERAPTPETAELLRSAEAALHGALRRQLIDKPHVPSLLVGAAHLKALRLPPHQLYLLSRIDGKRDLGTIISAPLQSSQELEALKSFQDFVEQGLVKLTPRG